MGIDNVVICPVAKRRIQTRQIDVTHRHQHTALLAINHIAINIKQIRETVEVLDELQLRECGRDDIRVKETHRLQSPRIFSEIRRRWVSDRAVVLDFYLVDSVRSSRGVDMPLNVRRFANEFTWLDLQLLDDGWIDTPHEHRGRDKQPKAENRQAQSPAEGRTEKQGRAHECNAHENLQCGQMGMHVCVLQTSDQIALLESETKLIKPIRVCLEK